MKADPGIKAVLKLKKFKWKTVINDQASGMRSEVLEVANTEYQKQLIRSQAEIFRENLSKEDILKEPLVIDISSLVAFGSEKNPDKQNNLRSFKCS